MPDPELPEPPHRAPRAEPRVAAFFDMDKTLIAENSGAMFMKYRFERGEVTSWEVARGLAAYLRYKIGTLNIQEWARNALREFEGHEEHALAREIRERFAPLVIDAIYPEARELVEMHRKRGHLVAIVTGATRFVVEPLAEALEVEHMLYTRLEVEDGRFTGRVIEPVCFEEGKIFWLEQFIEDQEIELARSYFYTDSVTDLPLLELVGHPVVTNPDPMLYRVARKRRWPVRIFAAPEAVTP
jgi:HAD superfamily hydrolase (TIGR01490 family)